LVLVAALRRAQTGVVTCGIAQSESQNVNNQKIGSPE
jgi:hypothetical protein